MTLQDFADFHSRSTTPPGFFKKILLVHGCQIATIIHLICQIVNGKENYSQLLAGLCNYCESQKLIDMPPIQRMLQGVSIWSRLARHGSALHLFAWTQLMPRISDRPITATSFVVRWAHPDLQA
jgi:hypothetical protein